MSKGFNIPYIGKTLSKDEEIKEFVKLHWFNYICTGLLVFIVLLFLILDLTIDDLPITPKLRNIYFVFVIWVFYDFLKIYTTEMVITNKRVICKTGIIGIKTEELLNSKIESIEVKQTIGGRIFGYANICFSGTGTSKVKFRGIKDPWG